MMAAVAPPSPLVVVGGGRVGLALSRMGAGLPQVAIQSRSQHVGDALTAAGLADAAVPILVIAECPPARRPDLVFCQNGMLLPLLDQHGLASNTAALLYLSAAADGSYTDGRQTVVCGRWAGSVAALLHRGCVQCRVVERGEFQALMIEKLLWASIYWLLSAGLNGLPVGAIAQQHGDDAAELAAELLPLAQRYVLDSGRRQGLGELQQVEALTADRVAASMASYSLSIPAAVPSRDMALAEFAWRNSWFISQQRTPAHVAWLARAGLEA
ncbi:hypothetical protein COHA_006156 [Chlorella ohadii]|uniref:Uncharacterized protein n=1 Tax=Chlorella ohadii TaxID=2649997 RepID=A0AAD5DLP2_9CHLO|nr:hypothetical protein COHA_006156 [Chlorella ohadii]